MLCVFFYGAIKHQPFARSLPRRVERSVPEPSAAVPPGGPGPFWEKFAASLLDLFWGVPWAGLGTFWRSFWRPLRLLQRGAGALPMGSFSGCSLRGFLKVRWAGSFPCRLPRPVRMDPSRQMAGIFLQTLQGQHEPPNKRCGFSYGAIGHPPFARSFPRLHRLAFASCISGLSVQKVASLCKLLLWPQLLNELENYMTEVTADAFDLN